MASLLEEEYTLYRTNAEWNKLHKRLRHEAKDQHVHTMTAAKLPENMEKNRYNDNLPNDAHRVKLEDFETDYINASTVQVPEINQSYILTQGPLEHTTGHFWLMVWQQGAHKIVMLNKIIENGKLKCHQYFPEGSSVGGDDVIVLDDVGLRVEYVSCDDLSICLKRVLRLVNMKTDEARLVLHFHYTDWPDFDVPQSTKSFLDFRNTVRQSEVGPRTNAPPVVHCSAGIGRAGTFCLVDSALCLVEQNRKLDGLNVQSLLLGMRQYRPGLVQTADQLQFAYQAILDGSKSFLSPDVVQRLKNLGDPQLQVPDIEVEAPVICMSGGPPGSRLEKSSSVYESVAGMLAVKREHARQISAPASCECDMKAAEPSHHSQTRAGTVRLDQNFHKVTKERKKKKALKGKKE